MKKKQKNSTFEWKTRELEIRPYRSADFYAWFEFVGEAGTASAFALILNLQALLNSNGSLCHLGVFERESGALIGMIVFHSIERNGHPRGEVELWIPEKNDQKKYEKELADASVAIANVFRDSR
jgi:RimJ/RimL family protein N-acetyltransferase